MAVAALILLHAAVLITGFAALSLLSVDVLRRLSRLEKSGTAILLGLCVHAFVALLLIFAGVKLAGWIPAAVAGAALLIAGLRRKTGADLFAIGDREATAAVSPFFRAVLLIGAAGLFTFVLLAAVGLPTFDYDGLVIWSTRLKVLLNERTIYSEALQDPARLIPQPKHPYLLPVMQALFCLPFGNLNYAASHLPYVWVYLAYLFLAWRAGRFAKTPAAKIALVASLVLLPAIAAELFIVSAREPIVAVLALASTYYLCAFLDERTRGYLLLSGFFALMVQQSKIDGLPFAAGWITAVIAAIMTRRATIRDAAPAIAMFAFAVPWALVKARIASSPYDPVYMSNYAALKNLQVANVAAVLQLIVSELFLRPELYAFAPHAMIVGLFIGWRREDRSSRLLGLLPPLAACAAVIAVYALRQGELPPERNASITRHVIGFVPALILAAWYRPRST